MTRFMETTEYEYWLDINQLKNTELAEEYKALLEARRRGMDTVVNLQERFNLLNKLAESRGVNIKAELYPVKTPEQAKKEVTKEVEMIKTPDSSSVKEFGYDCLNKVLFIQYKSGETVYTYVNVEEPIFKEMKTTFEKGESVGKFIANKIRGKFRSPESKVAGGM